VLQSGPFLTPYESSTDPGGTNILTTIGQTRSDLNPNMPIYPSHRTTTQWLLPPAQNSSDPPSAFSIPADNRGFFGTAGVGSIIGPGTANFSLSLSKAVALTEKSRLQFSVEAANVFNHRNYEPPDVQVDSGGFGSISALQTAEGAGPRSLELAARITF
jgi:hypothetical protein